MDKALAIIGVALWFIGLGVQYRWNVVPQWVAYGFVAVGLVIAIPAVYYWTQPPAVAAPVAGPASTPAAVINNDRGIVTQGQTGGSNTVINQAPEPSYKVLKETTAPEADGSFKHTTVLQIDSPYPPANLRVIAKAEDLISLEAFMIGTNQGINERRPGEHTSYLLHPAGEVTIWVKSRGKKKPSLSIAFNKQPR